MTKKKKQSKTRSERFAEAMAAMQAVFCPDKPVSKERVSIYNKFLDEYPIEFIELAVSEVIKTKKISVFPTLAEIIEKIEGDEKALEGRALVAWSEVNRLLPIIEDVLSDPVIDRAVQRAFGTYDKLRMTDLSNEVWDRRHFVKCYAIAAKENRQQRGLLEGRRKALKGNPGAVCAFCRQDIDGTTVNLEALDNGWWIHEECFEKMKEK